MAIFASSNRIDMTKNERNVIELKWEDAGGSGKFEAAIVNGELKHFNGIGDGGTLDIYTNNYKFLLAARDRINELEEQVKIQLMKIGKNGTIK